MKKLVGILAGGLAFLLHNKASATPPENPRVIFLVMCNWVGDTFWALQVIPELGRRFPDAELHIGVKGFSKDLFWGLVEERNITILNNVISDRTRERFKLGTYLQELRSVRRLKVELMIDLTSNRYSALFSALSNSRCSVGLDCHELSALYGVKAASRIYQDNHLLCRPRAVVYPLLGPLQGKALFPVKSVLTPADIMKEYGIPSDKKNVLVLPGAGWKTKRCPAARFIGVCRRLEADDWNIILAGSRSETALCESIASSLKSPIVFVQSLSKLIALLGLCDLVIANDSGVSHLAASAGIPTIAIFCPTNPSHCGPVGERVRILRSECSLRAEGDQHHCVYSSSHECPRSEWMSLGDEEIMRAIRELLDVAETQQS